MARPPLYGRVKTRLAKQVGDKTALEIYDLMLEKTFAIAKELNIPTTVFFSEQNDYTDKFSLFNKEFQAEGDLGNKMKMAFQNIFDQNYRNVIMIGTDCPDNSYDNLNLALQALKTNDVVFGPSNDGGYYLVGMTALIPALFDNKIWSTNTVYQEALEEISLLKLKSKEVATINDIDTLEDLKKSNFYKFMKTID